MQQADSYDKFLKEQEELLKEANKNKVVKLSDVTVVIDDYFGAPPEPAWPPLAPASKIPDKQEASEKEIDSIKSKEVPSK